MMRKSLNFSAKQLCEQNSKLKYFSKRFLSSTSSCQIEVTTNNNAILSKTPIVSNGTPRAPSPTNNDPLIRFYNHSKQSVKAPRILITGGMGQLGRSLASIIKYMYGRESVLLTDICMPPKEFTDYGGFRYLNILDKSSIDEIVVNNRIDTIVHFSALLSAIGEKNTELALQVNCQGVQNILNTAKAYNLKIFIPSTIGAFGLTTPRVNTPDLTIQRPNTIYGVTKVFAELLGEYYFTRFGVDFRSLRFPGIISNTKPGGGTTDYAIQIFYDAILHGKHECYLRPDTCLPMMYDIDCMASIIGCLLAPSEDLTLRTYNVTGFSFTPEQIADEIRKYIPNFEITYNVCSVRQSIANSWPQSLDDSQARKDWRWRPEYNLNSTVQIMLQQIESQLNLCSNQTETVKELKTAQV